MVLIIRLMAYDAFCIVLELRFRTCFTKSRRTAGHMNGSFHETSKPRYERQDAKAIQWMLNLHQIGS